MGRYLIFQRALAFVFSILLLIILAFSFLRLLPGGPFDDSQVYLSSVLQNLSTLYGAKLSLGEQFLRFLHQLVHFNFGPSLAYPGQSVTQVIRSRSVVTLQFGALAVLLTLLFSFLLSLGSALGFAKKTFSLIQLTLVSLPLLLVGPLLIWFFGFYLNCLPTNFNGAWTSYFLPTFLLALRPTGTLSRLLSSSFEEILRQPWALTFRGFGFPPNRIGLFFALRLTLVPFLAVFPPLLAHLLAGSILIESLFSIQGLGLAFLNSIYARDYTLTMVLLLCFGSVLLLASFAFDFFSRSLDPRIRT